MKTPQSTLNVERVAGTGGALCGALAVLLGAFGAHALREHLGSDALAIWRTAVDYLFWHALVLVLVAARARQAPARSLCVATPAFLLGIVLFCGSLIALALGASRMIGYVTPLGGAAFLVGWIALCISFIGKSARNVNAVR